VDRTIGAGADREDQAHLVGDREHLVDAGVHAFIDSPFLGTGLDNFRYVTTDYNLFATPQLPHNLWLQLLVQVGVIGTVAFAIYLLAWWRDVVACFRRVGPADRHLLWAVAASFAGILTIFMFAPEMLDRHYWLIVALGLAVVHGTTVPPPVRPTAVVIAS
jgi:O-antigen ligase